jgi:hypothetical protein
MFYNPAEKVPFFTVNIIFQKNLLQIMKMPIWQAFAKEEL